MLKMRPFWGVDIIIAYGILTTGVNLMWIDTNTSTVNVS